MSVLIQIVKNVDCQGSIANQEIFAKSFITCQFIKECVFEGHMGD